MQNRRGRGDSSSAGKRNLGRSRWSKTKPDKRKRNEDEQAVKRQKVDRGESSLPVYATHFSNDDIAAEERRPKKKVAVLLGYSGTGYRGMQLAHDQKTIEGDLFKAFVAAGAISKANADDPKKSSFVRCARTDKGVHAAGNIVSLKLIVEENDIVERINEHLPPQIRIWGYERTNNSFSAYQLCDSRIYEYLIPTHSFLPPHPSTFLGQKIAESARENEDEGAWRRRQEEVGDFWDRVDEEHIKPILAGFDDASRAIIQSAQSLGGDEEAMEGEVQESLNGVNKEVTGQDGLLVSLQGDEGGTKALPGSLFPKQEHIQTSATSLASDAPTSSKPKSKPRSQIAEGLRKVRAAYLTAKRSYRISSSRLERVQKCLAMYEGTRNYHNFTVHKTFRDPSAKRVIKSFVVNPNPILIDGTEWLSLKVHGQSFMMHQIRKMVGMVALVVRCGCDPRRIVEAFGDMVISIPKAPSLGLLLERPVFDSYNKRAKSDLGREALDFGKYETAMEEFKGREIYGRIYRDEEQSNMFGNFFNHIDNFASEAFLFVTSGGISTTRNAGDNGVEKAASLDVAFGSEADDERDQNADGEEG